MQRWSLVALIGATGAVTLAPAAAQSDPTLTLINRSERPIIRLYVSPSTRSDWGYEWLGRNALPNGQSFVVRLPVDECIYDIRVFYPGGVAAERRRVDLCDPTAEIEAPRPPGR